MIENGENQKNTSIIDTEKISLIFSRYKYPFIFGGLGLLLFVSSLILLLKNQAEKGEVVFSVNNESTSSGDLKVDIQGFVMSPGVYSLKNGSRVVDALSAAGGLSAEADRDYLAKNLNQAAKLTDGQKIYIPSRKEVAGSQSFSNSPNLLGGSLDQKKLNLNTASSFELEALPGIGAVTAAKIISGRPYQTVDDLLKRKIVGKTVFEKIKDLLTVF